MVCTRLLMMCLDDFMLKGLLTIVYHEPSLTGLSLELLATSCGLLLPESEETIVFISLTLHRLFHCINFMIIK
jgi:hypothetical protein